MDYLKYITEAVAETEIEDEKNKHYSQAYLFSIVPDNEQDLKRLENARKNITNLNRGGSEKFRIVLRGRYPRNKQNNKSYDYSGNIVGGLENATKIDVYMYKR